MAAILDSAIFQDGSTSNFVQYILKYNYAKFHACNTKCTMVSVICCTKENRLPKKIRLLEQIDSRRFCAKMVRETSHRCWFSGIL